MEYSVKFNDIELGQYIDVQQGFTPFSGADWAPELQVMDGYVRGTDFSYTTYKQKLIPMPFTILENIGEKCDALQRILNVDEPKPLIFEGAPDRVFYAIPSGDLELEETGCLGSGTITWLIPDGLAHATAETKITVSESSSGIMEATIVNNGTESVPVDYTIRHQLPSEDGTGNPENGFIGIVSKYGVIELGDIKELDGEMKEKSETLLNYRCYANYMAMTSREGIFFGDYEINGSYMEYVYEGVSWFGMGNALPGTGWHGVARTTTIPADSKGEVGAVNFALQGRAWFRPTDNTVNQLGIMEYAIADENGDHLMSVRIAKWDNLRSAAAIIFYVAGKEVGRVNYDPLHQNLTTHDTGEFYMAKSGSRFEFCFGERYPFDCPQLEQRKAKTVSVFIGQRDNYPLVEKMRMQYLTFRKDKVTEWRDIPNRYQPGDTVNIDGKSGKVFVNGNPAADDIVKGSSFFHVPPGETEVQFYFSDFCTAKPEVTAKIREAYL